MKTRTMELREEVGNLIIEKGDYNLINRDINNIVEKLKCSHFDAQQAFCYFAYSKAQESFRNKYFKKESTL